MKHAEIALEKPAVIAQAAPSVRGWGPYQFPAAERLPDGRLHCSYHVEEDSARAYGKDQGHAVSADGGRTWTPVPPGTWAGLLLPNGDRIRTAGKKAEALDPAQLPRELQCETLLNAGRVQLYDPDEFPYRFGGYYLMRQKAGTDAWAEERHDIHIPFASRVFYHNMNNLLPYQGFSRLRLAPDGRLWGIIYQFTFKDKRAGMAAIFTTSDDCGLHWAYRSTIYYTYKPNRDADFNWATRTGYTEPDLAFLPDGSLLCLLRTDDCFHQGPCYRAYSSDGGFTWTEPEVFDDRGVWPCLVTLDNGATLAGYGRPGLFLRATADPSGKIWEERTAVVEPGENGEDTCSYCDILPLDGGSFYLVYSDFNAPNADGAPCKTILGRRGTVRIQGG